jgi:hypothetical protein
MKSEFVQLEKAHQGLSKVEKMTILATATSKFPAAVICLQKYKTKQSKLKNRSFIKRSVSCLAIASLQKLENKQPVSIRQLMETERDGVATGAKVPNTVG